MTSIMDPPEPQPTQSDTNSTTTITIHHKSQPHIFTLPINSTIFDLSALISSQLSIPPNYQKLIAPRPLGIIKDGNLPIREVVEKLGDKGKIILMGSSVGEVNAVSTAVTSSNTASSRNRSQVLAPRRPTPTRPAHSQSIYTFQNLQVLTYLPRSSEALAFLQRLKSDPGIMHVMQKYQWTVPVLREMDPALHTEISHEGSQMTLGLNRNKGEIIELRLRTDDRFTTGAVGWRDYKTVRRTLVHELCHNVFGEHDRNFWDMYKRLLGEVVAKEWKEGGRGLVDGTEFYEPPEEELRGEGGGEDVDGGGGRWRGGTWVLGGGDSSGSRGAEVTGVSMREAMARAAEERRRKAQGEGGSRSGGSGETGSSSS